MQIALSPVTSRHASETSSGGAPSAVPKVAPLQSAESAPVVQPSFAPKISSNELVSSFNPVTAVSGTQVNPSIPVDISPVTYSPASLRADAQAALSEAPLPPLPESESTAAVSGGASSDGQILPTINPSSTPAGDVSSAAPPNGSQAPQNAAERLAALNGAQSSENKQINEKAKEAGNPTESSSGQKPSSAAENAIQAKNTGSKGGLSGAELKQISALAARDREVKVHEQQHKSVGGNFAGAASFSYQTGPDGVQYAIGGEVPIDISVVSGDPAATIRKMETVRAAALAPSDPSPADRAAASTATRIMIQAQNELIAQQRAEREAALGKDAGQNDNGNNPGAGSSSNSSADSANLPGADLPDKANRVGDFINSSIQAYNDFIKSQKDTGPLTFSQFI